MTPLNDSEKKFIEREDVQMAFASQAWREEFIEWLHSRGHELWQLPNTAADGTLTMDDPEDDFLTFCHRPPDLGPK